jgi:glycosyltransferase involved in cell wall biosynthesis
MTQPLVSIIIPVYRHARALHRALDSITHQTYKTVEVIIVDDGNTPPLSLPQPYHVVRQEHRGAPAARNRGYRESRGEYVIFWDADVVAVPRMIGTMVAVLGKNPEAHYAYSNFFYGWKRMPSRFFDGDALQKTNYIHSASMIRRSAVQSWDESLRRFQDWDLWLSMLEKGKKGVWIPEYLYRVLPHWGGMSRWLPSCAYQDPWRHFPLIRSRVRSYEQAKETVRRKHGLPKQS